MNKGLVAALCLAVPGWAVAETPSAEKMWQMIQQQQGQIEMLQKRLDENQQRLEQAREELEVAREAAESERGDDKEILARIDRTEQKVEATAGAVESVMSNQAAGGGSGSQTSIGSYGELHYNNLDDGEQMDLHRFVLFFGHQFRDDLSFFSELEVEHSIAGDGQPGEVEMEQAFLQWDYRDNHNTKLGLFLIPVGILNETHEPDTFYGVERNTIEKNIVPATWWEGGVAFGGEIAPGWGYDFAVHSGLNLDTDNPSASKRTSIRSARQKVGKANADSLAYTARLRYSGIAGLQWGTTLQYQSDLTQDDADGIGIDSIGGTLFETHVTLERGMFGLRALYARWDIDDEIELLNPGADEQTGWYVEPSVKLNSGIGLFARYGTYDLTAGSSLASNERTQFDIGINYWLHDNVVIKADFQRQDNDTGDDVDGFNLGVGYSF